MLLIPVTPFFSVTGHHSGLAGGSLSEGSVNLDEALPTRGESMHYAESIPNG